MTFSRLTTMKRIAGAAAMLIALTAATASMAQSGPDYDLDGLGLTGGDPSTGGSGDRMALDGIAAVVGNKVILISDVFQRVALLKSQSQDLGLTDNELYQEVLNDLIVNNLLLVQAENDSISVPDEAIDAQLEERIQQLARQAGGSTEYLERVYGKSMAEIRAEARPIIRDQILVELLRRDRFSDLKVTERDMEEFYRQYSDSLPQIPEQLEIAHILLLEKPSDESRAKAIDLAESIIDSLKNGADFAEFAKRYSIDPGSGAKGGELGWQPKGRFVKEFEDAAWELEINEISDPVVSSYGIHIIQLLDQKDGEVRTRHILLPLKASDQEKQALTDTLSMIRRNILDGKESFAAMARKWSDDENSKYDGGILAKYPTSDLPAGYQWLLDSMNVGEISEPRPIRVSPTESGFHIIKLTRIIPAHAANLAEDRDQIERLATVWKQNQRMLEWVDELRKNIYWEIKYEFK